METVGGNLGIIEATATIMKAGQNPFDWGYFMETRKPGFKEIGLPRIFILIILPNKISNTTNESDYIQASTARDIKTVRAN